MKYILSICTLFCLCISLSAQKFDHFWIGGINEFPGNPNYGNFELYFENGEAVVSEVDLNMNFESTVAVIADSTGSEIMLYSNGCAIRNGDGILLANGDGINPGEIHDLVCPKNGYIAPRGAMLLQAPSSKLYYMFHMQVEFDLERKLQNKRFLYTVIDKEQDEVISKNNLILEGNFEPFTAIRHGNGRDWWLVFPDLAENSYNLVLFDASGIHTPIQQIIGDKLFPNQNISHFIPNFTSSSAFSPDGKKYARFLKYKGVLLDFDRCAGIFSNPHHFEGNFQAIAGGGVAFSADSKKLYTCNQLALYETFVDSPSPTLDTAIGTAIGRYEIYGKNLHMMQTTPDGKIVVSSTNRELDMTVIHEPTMDGLDADLELKGIELPVFFVRGLPHFPHFRMFDVADSPCDTLGIDGISTIENIESSLGIEISPNPAKDFVHIESNTNELIKYQIIGLDGKSTIIQGKFKKIQDVDISKLAIGAYQIVFTDRKGKIQVKKIIKVVH